MAESRCDSTICMKNVTQKSEIFTEYQVASSINGYAINRGDALLGFTNGSALCVHFGEHTHLEEDMIIVIRNIIIIRQASCHKTYETSSA